MDSEVKVRGEVRPVPHSSVSYERLGSTPPATVAQEAFFYGI